MDLAGLEASPLPRALRDYVEVLKPRVTLFLTFTGAVGALIATGGHPSPERLTLTIIAIAIGSGGVNGLTNYIDRAVDARMERTQRRALPAGRIAPPEMSLPWAGGLTAAGLFLAWWLHPYAALAGLAGTFTAVMWRKTSYTHLLGSVTSLSPVALGWLALKPSFAPALLFLLLLVLVWTPLHVWSLMEAYRADFLQAGVRIFPVSRDVALSLRTLLLLSILLYAISWSGFWLAHLGLLYLTVANILGILLMLASWRLWRQRGRADAWRLYRLVTYPYLGIMLLTMMLEVMLI